MPSTPSIPSLVILLLLCAAALGIIFLLLVNLGGDGAQQCGEPAGVVSVNAPGSIVTVHRAGGVTSVEIRSHVSDHWEGGGVAIALPPVEVTRIHEPELYAEYISPLTSAIRKYEIIEELYAKGFTLPYLKGLNEQYKKEMKENPERTPADLTRYRTISPDESLREVQIPGMEESPPEEEPSEKQPSNQQSS